MSQETQEFALFKCHVQSCKYYFKNGSVAYFTDGRFATSNEEEIEELMAEIKARHPHIYIDDKEKTASSAMQDPMSALRAKIIAEYEAERKFKSTQTPEVTQLGDTGNTDTSSGAGAGTMTTESLLDRIKGNQTQSNSQ